MKNQFEDLVYRLTGLQCPFVRDSVTEEDFFLPNNEYRIKVIEWLIECCDKQLIQPKDGDGIIDIERQVQRVTKSLSILGLCKETDFELIKGNKEKQGQYRYIFPLVELAEISKDISSQDFFTESTLEELCQEELKKFEKLFSGKHIDSICSTSSQLFSTSKQLNILETKENIPTTNELENMIQQLQESTSKLEKELEDLQKLNPNPSNYEPKEEQVNDFCTSVRDLSGLVEQFSQLFKEEFEIWLLKDFSKPTEIGSTCQDVYQHQQKVQQILDIIGKIHSLSKEMEVTKIKSSKTFQEEIKFLKDSIVNLNPS